MTGAPGLHKRASRKRRLSDAAGHHSVIASFIQPLPTYLRLCRPPNCYTPHASIDMASSGIALARPSQRLHLAMRSHPLRPCTFAPCAPARHLRLGPQHRTFAASTHRLASGHKKESFRARLGKALRKTKIEWKPIPVALGVGFLGVFQFYRIQRDEKARQDDEKNFVNANGERPPKREKVRPSGPWYV